MARDLNWILYGTPTMDEVADAIEAGIDEEHLAQVINTHLITPEERARLALLHHASIEDLLNARIEEPLEPHPDPYAPFFDAWNARLGRRLFGLW